MGFTVIIVGGSVSGLSLANILETFGIDYVLLEGHDTIAPQLGASIGLLPTGLRILDQLGCYERIRELAGKVDYKACMRLFSGRYWFDKTPVSFSERLEDRIGYPQIFIDRQSLLQVLFDKLKHKERVLTKKRVTSVEMDDHQVTVRTQDGSMYAGDIVVGADGVHSKVREEMWRNALEAKSGIFEQGQVNGLQSDSNCIFGISKRPPGLPDTAIQINAFFTNCYYMILSAPGDRVYWFLFVQASRSRGVDIPRFTKDDERRLAERHFGDQITEKTTFEDIYTRKLHTSLVAIEDHVFPRWHFRKILTIGDAAHKVHPTSAQGGNSAMETAAVLVNVLRQKMAQGHPGAPLSEKDIEDVFEGVQEKQFDRVSAAVDQGRRTNSISIKDTLLSRIFVDHFFARFGQSLIFRLIIANAESGPIIEGLPVPPRHAKALACHREKSRKGGWVTWGFRPLGVGFMAILVYYSTLRWMLPYLSQRMGLQVW
ncbi:FAD binding domain-containing protein [Colletotrichum musicola]|uniref:FAD binding domain-containing protein n=1 Tax=Colletotrichum musicola TaxID=2175873 RepID=A0A8H6KHH2_9PEZI|nr:FAD binding domain-containing protein [Colletotrichum musicola]